MLRATLLLLLAIAACRHDTDPPPMQPKEGELPPLPPSSGTSVGYLVDNASTIKLRDDQLDKLKVIDQSLSARNDSIDTQLRLIERPEESAPTDPAGPPAHYNNAPGAQVRTTPDAAKLHAARRENDFEALQKAFAVLDPEQQDTARRLLEERGVTTPGGARQPKRPQTDDGAALEP